MPVADVNESAKLLPCPNPWCASHDEGEFPNDEDVWQFPALTPRYRVQCSYCSVNGPTADTEDKAITAWNARAVQPAPIAEGVTCIAKPLTDDERKAAIDKWIAPPAMDREAVERAAKAMAEAAKVGPWERMHEKAPRGWGPTACKSYWRDMANIALSTLSADAIRQGEGCDQCKGYGYFVTAPSTCSEGGDKVPCPKCQKVAGIVIATPASHASDGGKV